MKIQPLNDRILLLRVKEEEKTSGGIIIPDTAKEKPQEGKVVAVGPGKMDKRGKEFSWRLNREIGCFSASIRAPK